MDIHRRVNPNSGTHLTHGIHLLPLILLQANKVIPQQSTDGASVLSLGGAVHGYLTTLQCQSRRLTAAVLCSRVLATERCANVQSTPETG